MVVAFTITEINYLLVSLFCNVVLPISNIYLWNYSKVFGFAIYFVSGIATKTAMAFLNHSSYFCRSPTGQVIFKQMFFLDSVLQIVRFMVLC